MKKHLDKIGSLIKSHEKLMKFTFLKLVGEAIVFLFPLLIAKFVTPEVYGSYSLSMMIIFFSTTLILGASATPFVISANKEIKKFKSISRSFSNQLIFFSFSLGLIGLIFLIFNSYISNYVGISNSLLALLYLSFVGISIKSLLSNYFMGIDKKTDHTLVGIYYGLFLIFYLLILDFTLPNILLTYFLSGVSVLALSILKIDFKLIFPLKFDSKFFKKHLDFTLWQMFGLTAVYFINWGDTIIINHFLTLADVGVYNLAYQVFKGIISFMYIINTFYLPDISKNIKNMDYINKYLYKIRLQLFAVGSIGTVVLIFIVPFFISLFFDVGYLQAGAILQILLIGVVFKLWSIFYNPLYNVLDKYKYLQIMNIFQIILNIILGIALILVMGILGVALATTISYFARVVVDEIYFNVKVKKEINANNKDTGKKD